jgi:hypothetical protein
MDYQMRTFIVELTITEYRMIEIQAETMESAQAKAKDGFGKWRMHPSRLMETKIVREISTEELNRRNLEK